MDREGKDREKKEKKKDRVKKEPHLFLFFFFLLGSCRSGNRFSGDPVFFF
jgi:hypothetical protein